MDRSGMGSSRTAAQWQQAVEIAGLCAFLAYFVYIVRLHFWILPAPSDALDYLRVLAWNTSVGGFWPWLDRITLAVALVFARLVPGPLETGGPWYAMVVSGLTLLIGMLWLHRRQGFASGMV